MQLLRLILPVVVLGTLALGSTAMLWSPGEPPDPELEACDLPNLEALRVYMAGPCSDGLVRPGRWRAGADMPRISPC